MNDIIGGILGFAAGDAVGVPVEFEKREYLNKKPVGDMLEYGTHFQPIGTWSDDTSMVVATIDHLNECDNVDFDLLMKNYINWYQNAAYTATDCVFDMGVTTRESLNNFIYKKMPAVECGKDGMYDNGNGSLMRVLPMSYYVYYKGIRETEEYHLLKKFSSMTHAHDISVLGCMIYTDYIINILDGNDLKESYDLLNINKYRKYFSEDIVSYYADILSGNLRTKSRDEIKSSGFVVHTLEAVIWSLINTNSYEEAVISSVNLGDDTDTIGALVGGVAGTYYGMENIPEKWLQNLKKKDYLLNLSQKLENKLLNNTYTKKSK